MVATGQRGTSGDLPDGPSNGPSGGTAGSDDRFVKSGAARGHESVPLAERLVLAGCFDRPGTFGWMFQPNRIPSD
jgi:hypothetical protein